MTETDQRRKIVAKDHVDPEGSVVKSGTAIAEAAIEALKTPGMVSVAFDGLKGATSSYFNEFLRRIDQRCGRPELSERLQFTFDSKVQKMVFDRSLDALARRPHKPTS